MSARADAPTTLLPRRGGAREPSRVGWRRPSRTERGPLLAVCGLSGGAGTTLLAYLVALGAARQEGEPVLVADTGPTTGGLSALAGVEAPRSLPELASHLATGLPLRDGIYATGPAGLRVLAAGPRFSSGPVTAPLQPILADAREAHRLTVIDCGTLGRDVDVAAASAATHLAWVMLATERGVSRGQEVLRAAPRIALRELVVARREVRQPKAALHELRRIANERHAPLALVPHLDAVERGPADRALEQAQPAIQAILGATLR